MCACVCWSKGRKIKVFATSDRDTGKCLEKLNQIACLFGRGGSYFISVRGKREIFHNSFQGKEKLPRRKTSFKE